MLFDTQPFERLIEGTPVVSVLGDGKLLSMTEYEKSYEASKAAYEASLKSS